VCDGLLRGAVQKTDFSHTRAAGAVLLALLGGAYADTGRSPDAISAFV